MKNPRPSNTPPTDESSVVISLQELVRLERARVEDEAREKQHREAHAEATRLAAEQRRIREEDARKAAEAERTHDAQLRARMDDAQIEAAKLAELENRKLAQQQQLHLERLAAEERHAREMANLRAAKPRSFPAGSVAIVAATLAALAVALLFLLPRAPAPGPVDTAAADAQRAEARRAEEARADQQDQQIKALLAKVDELKKQPVPSASTTTTLAPPKPRPKLPLVHPKDEGCTVEIAGVPMCSKKPQ